MEELPLWIGRMHVPIDSYKWAVYHRCRKCFISLSTSFHMRQLGPNFRPTHSYSNSHWQPSSVSFPDSFSPIPILILVLVGVAWGQDYDTVRHGWVWLHDSGKGIHLIAGFYSLEVLMWTQTLVVVEYALRWVHVVFKAVAMAAHSFVALSASARSHAQLCNSAVEGRLTLDTFSLTSTLSLTHTGHPLTHSHWTPSHSLTQAPSHSLTLDTLTHTSTKERELSIVYSLPYMDILETKSR